MDYFSLEFLYALASIVVIDLVLAGDNAIVIALAAREVPPHLRRRAILAGAIGAVVVRSAMTAVVVWLLKIPGLLAAGGLLLVWIAWKLLRPERESGDGGTAHAASDNFWGALRTIVVADAVMGVDNVLGVAGAAQGSYLLVVLGLLISIPVVVWGSTLLLGFVERYPVFVYVGSGVLAATAVKMITAEPLLASVLAASGAIVPFLYLLTIWGVLWSGFVHNHRRLESRITARLAQFARQRAEAVPVSSEVQGERVMSSILIPVDGSPNARRAVRHVIEEARTNPFLQVHLVNVQSPFSRHVARFVARKSREDYHREQSEAVFAPLRKLFGNAGVECVTHAAVGRKAQCITALAARLHCDQIVMSTARKNSLTRMIEDSVTNRVLELTTVPVEVIAGNAVSKLERFGIPAGTLAALGFLVYAAVD